MRNVNRYIDVPAVEEAFDREALARICVAPEQGFGAEYGMTRWVKESVKDEENYFFFKDNGSDILAVAHLDTVISADKRMCDYVRTAAGEMVWSGSLDDRLGAYTILELLPKLGMTFDWLLTVGEERGESTAQFFAESTANSKEYKWAIEFDRGGTDVVAYQYHDRDLDARIEEAGARVARGSFSDIAYLEDLEVKAMNWGVGYRDYHGPLGHAFLADYYEMLGYFLNFYDDNSETYLPHEKRKGISKGGRHCSTGTRWGAGGWSGGGGTTWQPGQTQIQTGPHKGKYWYDGKHHDVPKPLPSSSTAPGKGKSKGVDISKKPDSGKSPGKDGAGSTGSSSYSLVPNGASEVDPMEPFEVYDIGGLWIGYTDSKWLQNGAGGPYFDYLGEPQTKMGEVGPRTTEESVESRSIEELINDPSVSAEEIDAAVDAYFDRIGENDRYSDENLVFDLNGKWLGWLGDPDLPDPPYLNEEGKPHPKCPSKAPGVLAPPSQPSLFALPAPEPKPEPPSDAEVEETVRRFLGG